jgi:UDP-N-acetylmuramoyl-tripeptide--D-alanyl-D-alanine ligase
MFQLNGYKNDEHINWIKKNLRQQWLLGFGMVLGIIRIIFPIAFIDFIIYLTLLLDILVYRAMRCINTKKKLVYTARVKRMIVTIAVISVAMEVIVYMLAGIKPITGICIILVSAQWFLNLLANIVNHPIESGISKYYINDAKHKLEEMPNLKVIGITGSYGKTSMKFYLQTLLQNKYNVLVTPGNFNTPLGVTITVRNYLKPTHEIFLCEMGARRVGEIKEVCDIAHPDFGIITSIGPQHLETFFNMENIQRTKFELADALPPEGKIFLNGDNDYIQEKATEYTNKIFYYSEKEGEGYCAKDIAVSQYGTEFTVVTPIGESERFQMKLIGVHNVINVVGAIAVANTLGMSLKELRIPVRRIQPVEHRMQMREHGLVTIIDDAYNSNPVGSKAAVETLAMFDGIRILITPGMVELGDKETEYNFKFGTYAADCCDYILLVGRKHTEPIKEGALSKGFSKEKCLVYDKLEEAIAYAYAIKGQGHKYILLENDLPDNY